MSIHRIQTIDGRADDTIQKLKIAVRLYRAWLKVPALRLGQLISNSRSEKVADIFYVEDERLIEDIEIFVGKAVHYEPSRIR
jgi:hypothetical protein